MTRFGCTLATFVWAAFSALPALARDDPEPKVTAQQAIESSRKLLGQVTLTAPWIHETKHGGYHLHVGVLSGGKLIGKLHLHPRTGAVISKERARALDEIEPTLTAAKAAVKEAGLALRAARVAEHAKLAKHGEHWDTYVIREGEEILKLRHHAETGRPVEDWKAARERRRSRKPLGSEASRP
jgi:hypothetical protein